MPPPLGRLAVPATLPGRDRCRAPSLSASGPPILSIVSPPGPGGAALAEVGFTPLTSDVRFPTIEGMVIKPTQEVGNPLPTTVRGEPVLSTDVGRRRHEGEHWSRRRDLERQLHDGPALRIAALTLRLGIFREKLQLGVADLRPDIDAWQKQLHMVQKELRTSGYVIYRMLLGGGVMGPRRREAAM